jgi:hypothetical protein
MTGKDILEYAVYMGVYGSPLLAIAGLLLWRPKGWSALKWSLAVIWLSAAITSLTIIAIGILSGGIWERMLMVFGPIVVISAAFIISAGVLFIFKGPSPKL